MELFGIIATCMLVVLLTAAMHVNPEAVPSGMRNLTRALQRTFEPYVPQEQVQAYQEGNLSAEAEQIKAGLAEIKTQLSTRIDERFNEMKDGIKVPDQDPVIKRLEGQIESLSTQLNDVEAKSKRLGIWGGDARQEHKSSGAQLVEHLQETEFKTGGGRFTVTHEQKALTGASASAGLLVEDVRLPMFDTPTEPHIRDLLPQGTTNGRVLKFPRRKLSADVKNAAMVAEGAAKPQSDFAFEMVSNEVKKIAHYVKTSDEILEDYPALMSYIDAQLIDGLMDVEDEQLLKGDGTGNNLLGLYTQAQVFDRATTGTLIDVLLRANTQLRLVNRRATGIVLNPINWEEIVLAKGSDSHYIWANVQAGNGQRLWALPVRDSTKLDEDEWMVGDFQRGAQIFDRRQAAITIANQNEDDFVKNMLTILAEERLALVTYDALSFVKNPAIV